MLPSEYRERTESRDNQAVLRGEETIQEIEQIQKATVASSLSRSPWLIIYIYRLYIGIPGSSWKDNVWLGSRRVKTQECDGDLLKVDLNCEDVDAIGARLSYRAVR